MVKRTVPRRSLQSVLKKHKPQLRLSKDSHIMEECREKKAEYHLNEEQLQNSEVQKDLGVQVHESPKMEARTKAVESKSSIIQPNHVKDVAKAVLKKSRG